jgi:hypothetical protein
VARTARAILRERRARIHNALVASHYRTASTRPTVPLVGTLYESARTAIGYMRLLAVEATVKTLSVEARKCQSVGSPSVSSFTMLCQGLPHPDMAQFIDGNGVSDHGKG